ncbi:GNAT family N-acetyltransferase [Metasolibacillus sp. FSL H7-0170]|uniref:GNAT family N-acetyltransferase n=1 Tax=Metasolibacillus TaxID=2703677 RepID=UPI0007976F6A|nr:GNAT family N-acetyltransferase [Metasolibacillus fluoroglycofenilyticus]KYG91159.1 GNAT family acetyltransferase [[Bacillus] sp. KCTC 13219]
MQILHTTPTVDEFLTLRKLAGMGPRDREHVQAGLNNSCFSVILRKDDGELIGMGRVIGDGGTAYVVVDIAVHPDEQGKGLGKMIMTEIKHYLDTEISKQAFVSLIADVPAHKLYEKFGFVETAPKSIAMAYIRK